MADYGDAMMRNNQAQNAALQARTKAQSRANVMQLKMIGSSHPTGLTNNLLKLFEPRPPLEYKPPPEKRKCPPYSGMAGFVSNFAEPGDPQYALPVDKGETPGQRRARIHQLRLEEGAKKVAEELEKYDPSSDPNATGDPYKTLFVAKLNYETTESRIKKEFEAYGPIKRVRLVTDKDTSKPRGYAFVEYVHTRDMKAAYKQADGKKIDNRRVLVDVERGRTVPNWRPRRLGGGLGTTRVAVEEVIQIPAGREQVQSGGVSRSEEPKVRDERDREKSRERGRDREREREKSRERSHDRTRDRERKDDRHPRDRDRTRDRGDRDKDRTRDRGDRERDRTRDRGRDREHRDRHREKGRSKDRERDYDVADDRDRGISRERDRNYGSVDVEDIHGSDRAGGRPEKEHAHGDYDYYETEGRGHYDDKDGEYGRYGESHRDSDRYDQMDEDGYGYDQAAAEPQDKDKRRSNRSISREYEY